jgi:signal transduction histidine kinase
MYELNIGEGIDTMQDLKSTIQRFSLWMLLVVILISIFLDLSFVRFLMRPLNKIIGTKLQPVPSPASFNFTKIPSSTFEFNKLDESMNEMMHKLQDTFQTEKEFISNVSHELQTPISIIQNKLENLIVEGKVSEDVMIRLTDSLRTLSRMSKIIKALLLISKIENDQYLKQEEVDIQSLLDEVIEEIEDRLQQRNIQLIKKFYDNYTYGPCNKALMFTMLFNIINNAIKYNKDGGSINITTRMVNGGFTVEIQDSGIGIDESSLSSIFDRFKRLNKNNAEGYGLGLPIVKTIAGFHHIDVKVVSEPEIGTTFILTF